MSIEEAQAVITKQMQLDHILIWAKAQGFDRNEARLFWDFDDDDCSAASYLKATDMFELAEAFTVIAEALEVEK